MQARTFGKIILVASVWALFTNCEDGSSVHNPENNPPQILLYGPTYTENDTLMYPFELPWIAVGDAEGDEDIAAVVYSIESIYLEDLIVRPDGSDDECIKLVFTDNDTINVEPYLDIRSFETHHIPLERERNGVYIAPLVYRYLLGEELQYYNSHFGESVKDCWYGDSGRTHYEAFGFYPDGEGDPIDVYHLRSL